MKVTNREKLLIIIGCLLLLIILWQLFEKRTDNGEIIFPTESQSAPFAHNHDESDIVEEVQEKIVIDVKGAVKIPGVYEMDLGDRVIDAIEKAGGLSENAEEKALNLASLLQDEMVIYVPILGEDGSQFFSSSGSETTDNGKVSINSATVEELQKLSGIGPAKAEAIVKYREEIGVFQSFDDLLQVSGIGEKSLEQMKDQIEFR